MNATLELETKTEQLTAVDELLLMAYASACKKSPGQEAEIAVIISNVAKDCVSQLKSGPLNRLLVEFGTKPRKATKSVPAESIARAIIENSGTRIVAFHIDCRTGRTDIYWWESGLPDVYLEQIVNRPKWIDAERYSLIGSGKLPPNIKFVEKP